MLNFKLATPSEIGSLLGERLKLARQAKGLQQAELAKKVGISRQTLATMEAQGRGSLTTMIQLAMALGIVNDLQDVFKTNPLTIADLEKLEQPAVQRVRKPRAKAVQP